jgi:hypothetical protein
VVVRVAPEERRAPAQFPTVRLQDPPLQDPP